jgi:hypothetical protein
VRAEEPLVVLEHRDEPRSTHATRRRLPPSRARRRASPARRLQRLEHELRAGACRTVPREERRCASATAPRRSRLRITSRSTRTGPMSCSERSRISATCSSWDGTGGGGEVLAHVSGVNRPSCQRTCHGRALPHRSAAVQQERCPPRTSGPASDTRIAQTTLTMGPPSIWGVGPQWCAAGVRRGPPAALLVLVGTNIAPR